MFHSLKTFIRHFGEKPELIVHRTISNDTNVKLNLGCNQNPKPGYINVDLEYYKGVDLVVDLTTSWPWRNSTVDEIVAHDILEHLPNIIHTMNEAWRVLRAGGLFDISVPSTDGRGAFQDPTHLSFWNENTFLYFIKDSTFRSIYPNKIQAEFQADSIATTDKDCWDICWVRAILHAIK